jgi:hypothetical protein
MTEEKKQGFLAKLFGGRGCCCCNVRIEEATDSEAEKPGSADADAQGPGNEAKPAVGSVSRRTGDGRGGDRT